MSFEQILDFIHSQNAFIIYAVLVVSAFIENIFPPFPGDAVMLAGAFIAGEGNISYIGVLISAVIGGTGGALVVYQLGKTSGRKFFESGPGRYLIKGNLGRAERLFSKHGSLLLLASRFLAGIRSAIAVTAGIVRFDVMRMTVLTFLGVVLWNGALIGLMIYSKSNWRMMVEIIRTYNFLLIAVGLIIFSTWIARGIWRKRRNSRLQS
jgi:membrane protein DedA with SNARE-associated domain